MNQIHFPAYVATHARCVVRTLSIAFAALTTGSRTIPMGDNGPLLRELAARAAEARASGPQALEIDDLDVLREHRGA